MSLSRSQKKKENQTKQVKSQEKEGQDLSFQSDQTAYDDPIEEAEKNTMKLTGNDENISTKSKQVLQNELKFSQTDKQYLTESKQRKILSFPSVSKFYEQTMMQTLYQRRRQSMHTNSEIKVYLKNIQTLEWKLSTYKKALTIDSLGNSYFQRVKNLLVGKEISMSQIQQKQIIVFRCQCGKKSLYKRNINIHLKQTSHRLILNIDTQQQRRHQRSFYKQVGREMKNLSFIKNCLYKSFQVIFLEGDFHFSQVKLPINYEFMMEVLKLNFQEEQTIKFFNQKKGESYFKNEWLSIYDLLHEFHQGNEHFCHKCLSLNEHICLFALGLDIFLQKSRKTILFPVDSNKMNAVCVLLKQALKKCIENSKLSNTKMHNSQKSQKKFSKICVMVWKMLMNYLKNFEYIDISELYQCSNEKDCQF